MVVFGTRPEAIKMAPVVRALAAQTERLHVSVVLTAQHREMLDQVVSLFELHPDHDLDLMSRDQDLYDITAGVLTGLRKVMLTERPDLVLVHGDTTTSMAAALAAFYLRVPVGHVEAGLRTRDIYSPYPEEMNRQLTGRIATYHFAPTAASKRNLLMEGVPASNVFVTGNTAIDALLWMMDQPLTKALPPTFGTGRKGILVTAHRRESFGEGIRQICLAILDIVNAFADIEVVYPVHLNPSIWQPVHELLGGHSRVRLISPVDYRRFVRMMSDSHIILTDSGGVQEEAPSLGKPVFVMRDCTERPEAVAAGTVRIVGADRERIVSALSHVLRDQEVWTMMSQAHNPYGDGMAAERIAAHVCNILAVAEQPRIPVTAFEAPL